MTFKVGDQVTVVGSTGFSLLSVGRMGYVSETDDSRLPVCVRFNDDDSDYDWGCYEDLAPADKESFTRKLFDATVALEKAKREHAKLLDIAITMGY